MRGLAMLYLTIKGSRPAAFRQFLWGVAIYAAVCLFLFGWFDEYYLAIYRDIDHNAGDLF